ncbi:MAG: diphthine synthase [Methanobacteriota archaeon]
MGELVFIGLGLHDERGITLRGLDEAKACDAVYAEFYTSALAGTRLESIESLLGKSIRVLSRADVEDGTSILQDARSRRVALLVPGDPMAATTHVDLRLRAAAAGIPTRIVHGASILSAAAGVLGLQAYKFGRTTSVPSRSPGFEPTSPLEAILANLRAGLHTLVLLDLVEGGPSLDPKEALRRLVAAADRLGAKEFGPRSLACVVSRAGAPDVRASAAPVDSLLRADLGPPLHAIVIPGPLHFLEKEALVAFAAPKDL